MKELYRGQRLELDLELGNQAGHGRAWQGTVLSNPKTVPPSNSLRGGQRTKGFLEDGVHDTFSFNSEIKTLTAKDRELPSYDIPWSTHALAV